MLSAIEANVGIICACLPSMRPLLTSMMPGYFPEGTQLNSTKFDGEQPKDIRYYFGSDRPYTADSLEKPDHSRTVSVASQYSTSRGHSRSGSIGPVYVSTAPVRPQATSAGHSRSGSRNGHSRATSVSMTDTDRRPSSSQHNASHPVPYTVHQLNLINGHQHPMNPLRMSPFAPVVSRLPRLPENMAVLGPLESQSRPIRMPLFHKPLPITPLPGHQQNSPQYLTPAQDQAMLPMMLSPTLSKTQSPGLMPEPLKLGIGSPAPYRDDRQSKDWL